MGDEARINGGAGLDAADEDAPLGVAEAAAIMREQDARVRQAFRFGLWLAVAAAGGAFAGPAGVWGVDALAAGLAFLFMAFAEPRLRH